MIWHLFNVVMWLRWRVGLMIAHIWPRVEKGLAKGCFIDHQQFRWRNRTKYDLLSIQAQIQSSWFYIHKDSFSKTFDNGFQWTPIAVSHFGLSDLDLALDCDAGMPLARRGAEPKWLHAKACQWKGMIMADEDEIILADLDDDELVIFKIEKLTLV